MILDGKRVAASIKEQVAIKAKAFKDKYHRQPTLAVIMIGDDSASKVYVKNKSKAAHECGIAFNEYLFTEQVEESEVIQLIRHLSDSNTCDGILVQLPLPKKFNTDKILHEIPPAKDVDGFTAINFGSVMQNKNYGNYIPLPSCTPAGCMEILKYYNIDIAGKDAVIIGRSNNVGKPMAMMLLNENATVTICHSKTKDLKEKCLNADIIISAVGKRNLITADMINKEKKVTIIDIGMNRDEDGNLCGDVDFKNVFPILCNITPVPGGVGPMTVAMLMKNTMDAAEQRENMYRIHAI